MAEAGYHEPSLVFHLGTDTELTDAKGAAAFLAGPENRIAAVADRKEKDFLKYAAEMNLHLHKEAAVTGFNYTKGRWVTLRLYTAVGKDSAAHQ